MKTALISSIIANVIIIVFTNNLKNITLAWLLKFREIDIYEIPNHKLRVYFEEDIRVWFTKSGKHFFQKEILLPYQEESGVYSFQGRIFTRYSAN